MVKEDMKKWEDGKRKDGANERTKKGKHGKKYKEMKETVVRLKRSFVSKIEEGIHL